MRDKGARNLVFLVVFIGANLFSFYGFLAYRARLWSPLWAIQPTEKEFTSVPGLAADGEDSPTARGRRLYREFRCAVCHGPSGEGGVKNPNADPDGVIPNLYDLADAFTFSDLKGKLLKGAHPAKVEESGPEPILDMPSWKEAFSEDEVDAMAQYLFSLKPSLVSEKEEKEEEEP
ncbi:MAG: cytochrome c [Elusimicrobia bacterium]|nr:cytochrome c [Elusimicrobiota bacterium]